ncbi:hypothetical protein CAPTEDRAFT_216396 [Capitella teleta]|uniref:Uncharacterized protein n=1 Tax=Capitella teleta TaxID=283909 RepID=R7VEN1_CAPTE|nr:hypothetical protein CAPTEDRAFT_216396 [Capitella teleta]|eukprot:ELU17089.1 hypothetical protein CAPTEDRAFT_216396 [Capitella teleta]
MGRILRHSELEKAFAFYCKSLAEFLTPSTPVEKVAAPTERPINTTEAKEEDLVSSQDPQRKAAVKKRDLEIGRLRKQVCDLEDGKGLVELHQVKWKQVHLLAYNRSRKAEAVVEGPDDQVQGETTQDLKAGGNAFGPDSQMMVYDLLVNSVPTKNIPIILSSQAERCDGGSVDVDPNLTLGFDSTKKVGVHINSIHVTSTEQCLVVAVDELAGGTTEDYQDHITSSIDYLATLYADYNELEFKDCREKMISNITNTMTDRATVIQATVRLLDETWNRSLNQLNCHLHPLDTIASTCRSTLRKLEPSHGKLFGKDSIIGNLDLQINKLRYKDGKGDPKGFKNFLKKHDLPQGLLPPVSCVSRRGLQQPDSSCQNAGHWPTRQVADGSLDAAVLHRCSGFRDDPLGANRHGQISKGGAVGADDRLLRQGPGCQGCDPSTTDGAPPRTRSMLSSCLLATVSVLERQYKRYLDLELSGRLSEETSTAPLHNIDAETVMGMFSAGLERAKAALIDYLAAKLRAMKNAVLPWLDGKCVGDRDRGVTWAIRVARDKCGGKQVRDQWRHHRPRQERHHWTETRKQQTTNEDRSESITLNL